MERPVEVTVFQRGELQVLRNGKVVYDLNGLTRPDWTTLPKDYTRTGDARWDAVSAGGGGRGGRGGRGPAAAPKK